MHCFYKSAFSTLCFILSAMDGKIKFCMKLYKSSTETTEMLREAFGEHSLGRRAVFEWHSRFKASPVSLEDDKRSGQPSISKMMENVEKIRELIHEGRHRTIHELADTNEISYEVCQEILTEILNMHRIEMKFVPRLLTNDQKQWSINVCLEL
jgi:hypothetical protein